MKRRTIRPLDTGMWLRYTSQRTTPGKLSGKFQRPAVTLIFQSSVLSTTTSPLCWFETKVTAQCVKPHDGSPFVGETSRGPCSGSVEGAHEIGAQNRRENVGGEAIMGVKRRPERWKRELSEEPEAKQKSRIFTTRTFRTPRKETDAPAGRLRN